MQVVQGRDHSPESFLCPVEDFVGTVVVLAAPRPDSSFGPGGSRQVLVGVDDVDEAAIGEALAAARDDRIAITRQG